MSQRIGDRLEITVVMIDAVEHVVHVTRRVRHVGARTINRQQQTEHRALDGVDAATVVIAPLPHASRRRRGIGTGIRHRPGHGRVDLAARVHLTQVVVGPRGGGDHGALSVLHLAR